MELSSSANFRSHEGLSQRRLGQRERRHKSRLIRTSVAAPRNGQKRILRQLKHNAVVCIDITDITQVIEVPAGNGAIHLVRLSAHNLLHVPRCDFFFRDNGLRDGVVIFNHFTGHDLHEGLHTLFVPVCGATTIRLIGFTEIEVGIVTRLGRFVGADLNGMLDQVGRSNDIFLIVQINVR